MGDIAKRAAEVIRQRVGKYRVYDEMDRLEITRQCFNHWEKGKHTPSGKVLQRMALAGYDVHYILTGERK